MDRKDYEEITQEFLKGRARKMALEQIALFYKAKDCGSAKNKYSVGEDVFLKKGTLLHGTHKNFDGLKEICKEDLISSWFRDGKITSKYPGGVGVWKLNKGFWVKDYVDFCSGGTIRYNGLVKNGKHIDDERTEVIPFSKMPLLNQLVAKDPHRMWFMEQTKEARFMPCFMQDNVQVGIIFNGADKYCKQLLSKDILDPNAIDDRCVKSFVIKGIYKKFIESRKHKDAFFTDRESAILFGLPANLIEGILVGRIYEKNKSMLKQIKKLLPNAYICNLDGKVIM